MSEDGRPGGRLVGNLLGAPVIVRERCRLGKFIRWCVSKPPGRGGGEEDGGSCLLPGGDVGSGGEEPPEEESRCESKSHNL